MWHTQDGIRKLQGAEARLVRAAAVALYEQLEDNGGPYQVGARAFDRLTVDRQRFAILAVAQRLTNDRPPLPLDAWAEATVYAIFECLHAQAASEIELSQDPHEKPMFFWRRLIREAYLEMWPDTSWDLPPVESKDDRDWDFAILSLTDCILWDRDFLDEDIYDGSECLPDYFSPQAPEWNQTERRELLDFYGQVVIEFDRFAA